MKVRIPLTILVVDKLAISVGGMRETELFGASDVIGEDTVANASLLGTLIFRWKRSRGFVLHVVVLVIARFAYEEIIWSRHV
jgi:hypothetical protein